VFDEDRRRRLDDAVTAAYADRIAPEVTQPQRGDRLVRGGAFKLFHEGTHN